MGFLDDLGQNIAKASQEVVNKTKNFADNTKYNVQISEINKYLNDRYAELGRMYFEFYKGNYNEKTQSLIDEITRKNLELSNLKQKIDDIKESEKAKAISKKWCSKCGTENLGNASFCTKCGNKFE